MNYRVLNRLFLVAFSLLIVIMVNACGLFNKTSKNDEAIEDCGCDDVSVQAQESLLPSILESGVLRVGTTGDLNPLTFKDPNTGEYVGHDIDLINALAEDMGVTVEFIPTDWKNIVSGVVAGKYDITTQASYNPGRAKSIAYTVPIQGVGTVPLTLKKNVSKYRSWESLNTASVKLATTLGTVHGEQMSVLLPNVNKIVVESPIRDFQEVLAGRADVSVTSNIEASQLIKTYPELAVIPVKPQFPTPMGLLVPQGDQRLKEYIDTWLILKKQGGFLDQLKEKWISLN